eukprot:380331-Amphidinium_carterae.1
MNGSCCVFWWSSCHTPKALRLVPSSVPGCVVFMCAKSELVCHAAASTEELGSRLHGKSTPGGYATVYHSGGCQHDDMEHIFQAPPAFQTNYGTVIKGKRGAGEVTAAQLQRRRKQSLLARVIRNNKGPYHHTHACAGPKQECALSHSNVLECEEQLKFRIFCSLSE